MSLESAIWDPAASVAMDFHPDRHVLMVAFAGLAGQIGVPLFEFNNLTSGLPGLNKIYLRDPHQRWYHRGLRGVGDNIDEIAAFLAKYTRHPATQRTVFFGNSGGGYAALLFGHLLQVDQVHAFSPRTFISPIRRLLVGDGETWKRLPRGLFLRHSQTEYFDLRRVLSQSQPRSTALHLYYAEDDRLDRLHALRMQALAGVQLHAFPHGKHKLIRFLKQDGELLRIIEGAVQLGAA